MPASGFRKASTTELHGDKRFLIAWFSTGLFMQKRLVQQWLKEKRIVQNSLVQKRLVSKLFALALLTLFLMPGAAAATGQQLFTAVDDDGHQIHLPRAADRIISLAPSMTELLFSLGVGDNIIGVMDYSDFPPQALALPIVGRHDMLDMERIIALQPDLIVAWRSGNPRSSLQYLRSLGFTVYVAEPDSLHSVASHLQRLGALTGSQSAANELSERFLAQLAALSQHYGSREQVSVFYQVWHAPIISVGGHELINDMISLCGGRNVFADLPVGPKVNLEDVLVRNPQVIIASGSTPDTPAWLADWQRWPQLDAVRAQHLYAIPPDLVQRHSLRALQGVRAMCEYIDQARS
jgi:iron complex transport system substrate-binding protein